MSPPLPTNREERSAPRRLGRLLAWPVWNRDQRRLRAPLRAVLPLASTLFAFAVVQSAVRERFTHPVREPVELLGFAVVLVVGVVGSARLVDRRPIAAYGLSLDRGWWRSFAVGGAIATAANAGTFLVALGAGWATVVGVARTPGVLPFLPAMGVTLAYIAVAAAWEEFVFRGALLKNLAEGADGYVPQWAAIAFALSASSVVFALLHAGKVDHPTQYAYYLVAGLVMGGAYVLTGELSLSVGFHAVYNFTMSAVFGLGVSQRTPELVVLDVVGPDRWIGEEGLAHVGFAVVAGALMLAYVRRRDGHRGIDGRVTRWRPGGK